MSAINPLSSNSFISTFNTRGITVVIKGHQPEIKLSNEPVTEAEVRQLFEQCYQTPINTPITFKLNKETGECFAEYTEDNVRKVVYLPGRFVQPHIHDIFEEFTIDFGGCHLWTSKDGAAWNYSYCTTRLEIPGGLYHCLVAGPEGLCMHVKDDSQRTTTWFTPDKDIQWHPQAKYIVSTHQLIEETLRVAK